jgi:hypothetical protein
MHDIIAHFLQPGTPPSYSAILRIEQRLREYEAKCNSHTTWSSSFIPSAGKEVPSMYIQFRVSILTLALHKTYFSCAVLRPDEDPLGGRLGLSTKAMWVPHTVLATDN